MMTSPRPSLETDSDSIGRITYLLNRFQVMTAFDFNGTVTKQNLMGLILPANTTVADLWVFDQFVVVQLTNRQILFYSKPLIMGFYMNPLTMITNNYTINPNLSTDDMSQSLTNSSMVYFYGVSAQQITYWTFFVNLTTSTVSIINQTSVSAP